MVCLCPGLQAPPRRAQEQEQRQQQVPELGAGRLVMAAGRDSRAMRRRWGLLEVRRCSSSSYIRRMMAG